MSLLDFYKNKKPNSNGKTLEDILNYDDEQFDTEHDFIQWLFPLPEKSSFNKDAPLLTPELIDIFKSDPEIQINLRKSFNKFLDFLGIYMEKVLKIKVDRIWIFQSKWNHNFQRITRVLRCLYLLTSDLCDKFYQYLTEINKFYNIDKVVFKYWTDASNGIITKTL